MPAGSPEPAVSDKQAIFVSYLSKGGNLAKLGNVSTQDLEATYSMAYNKYQGGQYEEAARAFQYLCFYDQWNPRNFICLGACQLMLGVYTQAIQTLSFAFKLDRRNPLPMVYVGDARMALKQLDKAYRAYATALKLAKVTNFQHEEMTRVKSVLSRLNANKGRN
ncbi:MAG: tetratricopeptide repeat protein [Endozoicomonas sp.]